MAGWNIVNVAAPLFRCLSVSILLLGLASAAGCASTSRTAVPPGTLEPDRFLYERGSEALKERRWLTAREFFRQVTDTYTQSPFRPDAKLGIGDSHLGEGSSEALVQAITEFQEFLSFYPTNPRADYAQYKLGMAYFRQMRAPQRDQTETKSAIREFEAFVKRYPTSSLMPEVSARLREARDRLSTSELEVGRHYYRIRWYPGAIDRLTVLLKTDPEYTRRDAVYYYLAETLVRVGREAEALPYFEKIVSDFTVSEHLEDARERIAELKAQAKAS
jgi:outer membrane protein assembly factor BamD